MNRGSRFCRPLPYHLATAPVGTMCREIPAASMRSNNTPRRRCSERRSKGSPRNSSSEPSSNRSAFLTKAHRLAQDRPGLPTVARKLTPCEQRLERETGFEPATSTLARSHSTTELFPLTRTRTVTHGRATRQPCGPPKTQNERRLGRKPAAAFEQKLHHGGQRREFEVTATKP